MGDNINTMINYIIIILVILIVFAIMNSYLGTSACAQNQYQRYERFRANGLDNPDMDLLDRTPDDSFTPHTHHHNVHYLSIKEFIQMVEHIKNIVAGALIGYAEACKGMNGSDGIGAGKYPMTLICNKDPWAIEEDIVLRITEFIKSHIKKKFNINLNNYHIIHDLMKHLNLLEAVIYPLQYSGLYTVNGIQYTNQRFIKQRVDTNLDVKDVLYTVLTRRNIALLVDTDQHIQ